jgi:hypothetical protein
MCGGQSKSALFEMHMCSATGDDLKAVVAEATELIGSSESLTAPGLALAGDLNIAAEEAQHVFGEVGDLAAANLMHTAKVWAGEVAHACQALEGEAHELKTLSGKGAGMEGADFSKSDAVTRPRELWRK